MTNNQVKLSKSQRALLSHALHDAIQSYKEILSSSIVNENYFISRVFKHEIEEAEVLVQLIEDAESVVINKGDENASQNR